MTSKVTAMEIAEIALRLINQEEKGYSDEMFKAKFAFAFDLLVDAEIQLQNLPEKLKKKES